MKIQLLASYSQGSNQMAERLPKGFNNQQLTNLQLPPMIFVIFRNIHICMDKVNIMENSVLSSKFSSYINPLLSVQFIIKASLKTILLNLQMCLTTERK
jgi:hypothetical protein